MIDPIEAIADCIMRFEGWYAPMSNVGGPRGTISWRNRNPGNLRDTIYPHTKDDKNYCIFESFSIGWAALYSDLNAKLTGHSEHNLTPKSTLHELINIYAPALDNNNPTQYSSQIAMWLGYIYNCQVLTSITLEDILKLGK